MGTCNRKVDAHGHCPIHENAPKTEWRWMPRAQFSDYTDTLWLNGFDNDFHVIIGKTASEVQKLLENGVKIENILRKVYFGRTYRLRLGAKLEEYNGESRPRARIVGAQLMSFG